MKYEWEKKIKKALKKGGDLPEGFAVVAVAVVNRETGEAALIETGRSGEPIGSVIEADYWKDISGDAQSYYNRAVANLVDAMGNPD